MDCPGPSRPSRPRQLPADLSLRRVWKQRSQGAKSSVSRNRRLTTRGGAHRKAAPPVPRLRSWAESAAQSIYVRPPLNTCRCRLREVAQSVPAHYALLGLVIAFSNGLATAALAYVSQPVKVRGESAMSSKRRPRAICAHALALTPLQSPFLRSCSSPASLFP